MDKISVIIPVYNIEKYVKKCILSVVNQTYSNLEILLVDDGSTDLSGIICDNMSELDDRIKVIHKKNGGLSDARNVGMENATGEYISFIDGDDYIEPEMLGSLLELCHKERAEIAIANVCQIYKDFIYVPETSRVWTCSGEEAVYQHFYGNEHYQFINAVWNKLYYFETIKQLRFPKGKNYEDICFTVEAYLRSHRVVCAGKNYYNYVVERSGSIMNEGIEPGQALSAIENCEERNKILKLYGNAELYELSLNNYLNQLFLSYYRIYISKKIKDKKIYQKVIQKKLLQVCKECKIRTRTWRKANLFRMAFFFSPQFCCLLMGYKLKSIRERFKKNGYY